MLSEEQMKCKKMSEQGVLRENFHQLYVDFASSSEVGISIHSAAHTNKLCIPYCFIRNSIKHRHKTGGSFRNSALIAPLTNTFCFLQEISPS